MYLKPFSPTPSFSAKLKDCCENPAKNKNMLSTPVQPSTKPVCPKTASGNPTLLIKPM